MTDRTKKLLVLHFVIAGGLCLLAVLVFWSGMGCPIRALTGIPCPSCGMTRATFDLLRLDFADAFSNHPFVFVVYPYLFFLFHYNARFLRRLSKAVRVGILAGGAALFAVIYIVRLSLGMIP